LPPLTFAFWVVKIFATTVGETGGDAVSMTLQVGYALSTVISLAFFCVTAFAQVASRRYHPVFYWAVLVATTTVGTTTSDSLDRTLALVAAAHFFTRAPDSILFWAAYIVTRPLGATLRDTLTKPHAEGGLEVGRIASSLAIAAAMVAVVAATSLRKPATASA